MNEAEIFEKVKKIVTEQLSVDASNVTPQANFANDLGADSLDTVELVMALEEEFDIEIPDEAAEQMKLKHVISEAQLLLVGIPVGVYTALHRDSWLSQALLAGSLVGISLPTFLIGNLLILVPAALESQINRYNADKITARIVVDG